MEKKETKKTTKKAAAAPVDPGKARLEALNNALGKIEKAYGRGAIMRLGDESVENVEVLSLIHI